MGEAVKIALSRIASRDALQRLRRELGFTGVAALVAIAASGIFYKAALEPLQGRAARLAEELERRSGEANAGTPQAASASAKLDRLYAFLSRDETTTDWLAKLYGIGKATGVDLPSGSYRLQPASADKGGRIEHYEIVLPVTATYGHMRAFLSRALAEMPVLSLDQMTIKRETRNDGAIQAELRLTLHMVKR